MITEPSNHPTHFPAELEVRSQARATRGHDHENALAPQQALGNLANPERWTYSDIVGNTGEIRVTPRLRATNGDVLRVAAAGGLGVICEPNFIVAPAIEAGDLVPLLTAYRWFGMDLTLSTPTPATCQGACGAL